MGMMRIMPRPQMLLMTIMMIATSAIGQFVSQLAMAELARISPMQMTMGPVTTGGKNRMMRCGPNALNSRHHQVQKPRASHAQTSVG